ncbi:MAG: EAL domain-containing protein [Thiobacillus sp.]
MSRRLPSAISVKGLPAGWCSRSPSRSSPKTCSASSRPCSGSSGWASASRWTISAPAMSSLSVMNQLPLDELKIDRAFVSALDGTESKQAMVTTVLNLARILGLNTVAEGVETQRQLDFLLHHGCQAFQGYHFAPPLPQAEFEAHWHAASRRPTAPPG